MGQYWNYVLSLSMHDDDYMGDALIIVKHHLSGNIEIITNYEVIMSTTNVLTTRDRSNIDKSG